MVLLKTGENFLLRLLLATQYVAYGYLILDTFSPLTAATDPNRASTNIIIILSKVNCRSYSQFSAATVQQNYLKAAHIFNDNSARNTAMKDA